MLSCDWSSDVCSSDLSQVRSLPVGISLFHSFLSTLKCALSQSVSPSSTHSLPLSSALSPSLHLSPPHHSHPIKCALSQSVSPTSTPFPPYQVRSLSVFISLSYSFPPYQVRPLPVGISLLHTTSTLKCALSQSASLSSTHSLPLLSALSPSRRQIGRAHV